MMQAIWDANNHAALFLQGNQRYEQVRYINKGTYGFVLQAYDRNTDAQVALKFIQRGGKITKYVEREILNHRRLRHPHIIDLREVFLTDDHLVLVMEYAAGGDLLERVARSRWLSEEEARWFFQQTMFAIDYCHRMGVANRDVKLENTLLKDRSPRPLVKLADFGFSKDENYQSAPGSRVGTPAYLAPEVISNVEGQHYDAKQADVWSCGVMLYTMVTGRYPFQRPEDQQWQPGLQLHHMLQRILHVIFDFPPGLPLTDDCKDLISRMLVADPSRRVTVQQVLQHPWCTKGMHTELHAYNDKFVEKTLANPPSPEELDTITKIVQEAATGPKREQGQQGAAGSAAAAAAAAAAAGAADGGLQGQGAVGGAGPMPTIKDDESGSEGGFDDDVLDPDSIDFDFEPV